MKHAILFFAALVMTCTIQAQTNKQVAGSKSFEVQFAPLGGQPISIGGIKYRSFSTEASAFRITANINYNSATDPILGGMNFAGDAIDLNSKESGFGLTLRSGLEKHLPGTDKLSPYYGGEALIGYSTSTSKTEYNHVELNDDFTLNSENIEEQSTKNSELLFGLNAIAGMDYYFAQNVFLGTEFGFGFQLTNQGDEKFEDSGNSENDTETANGSEFNLGPNFIGQIRLGIIF